MKHINTSWLPLIFFNHTLLIVLKDNLKRPQNISFAHLSKCKIFFVVFRHVFFPYQFLENLTKTLTKTDFYTYF